MGGLVGGVKVGRSRASLPLLVEVERLSPPEDFLVSLEQHLLLVYTGKTRLARNLLQVCPSVLLHLTVRTTGIKKGQSEENVPEMCGGFVCRMWFVTGTAVCLRCSRTSNTWCPTLRSVPEPVQRVRPAGGFGQTALMY